MLRHSLLPAFFPGVLLEDLPCAQSLIPGMLLKHPAPASLASSVKPWVAGESQQGHTVTDCPKSLLPAPCLPAGLPCGQQESKQHCRGWVHVLGGSEPASWNNYDPNCF